MKYCGKCGQPLSGNVKFCGKCGTPVAGGSRGIKMEPDKPKRLKRNIGKIIRVAAVVAVLVVVAGGVFWQFKDSWLNPSAKYHTEENGFVQDENGITYASPTVESHLVELPEWDAGIYYANNELIVQLRDLLTEREARQLAMDYNAELVGFISISGTCQWKLSQEYSYEELCSLADEYEESDDIETIYLNFKEENEASALPDESEWLSDSKKSSWFHDIGADCLEDYLDKMNAPISVCIYDGWFQEHEDLKYSFINPFNEKPESYDHGTHVAGIAVADWENQKGIRGVYPNPQNAPIQTAVWTGQTTIQKINVIAGQIMLGTRVINLSFAHTNTYAYILYDYYKTQEKQLKQFNRNLMRQSEPLFYVNDASIGIYTNVLKAFIDSGYEFLLVQTAGNASKRRSGDSYYLKITEDGETSYFEINNEIEDIDSFLRAFLDQADWAKNRVVNKYFIKRLPDVLNTSYKEERVYKCNIPAIFCSTLAGITDEEVKKRIIIVGAYDQNSSDREIAVFSSMDDRVDIMAPGVAVYSTANGTFDYKDGTSQAAPQVTGAIACIWSMDDTLTSEQVRSLLLLQWPEPSVNAAFWKTGDTSEPLKLDSSEYRFIDDSKWSGETKLALNLAASMRLADAYVNREISDDTSDAGEIEQKIVRIIAYAEDDSGAEYKASTPLIEIKNSNGEIVASENLRYQHSDLPIPAIDPTAEDSAYYISLEDDLYTITLSLFGYETITQDNLSPDESFDSEGRESPPIFDQMADTMGTTWEFHLKKKQITPEETVSEKPEQTVDPSYILETNLQSLVSQYGVMPTGIGSFEVGMSGSGEKLPANETTGLLFADVYDYDADGKPELLTFRNEPEYTDYGSTEHMILEMYEATEDGCVLSASMELDGTNISVGGFNRSVSIFRYEKEKDAQHLPFIGVEFYSEFNSQNTTLLTFQYWDGAFTSFSGANYGEWPGSDDMHSCYSTPVSEETEKYVEMDGDGFDYWNVEAKSSNQLDQSVINAYEAGLNRMGLSHKRIRSVYEDFNGTGGVAKNVAYCSMTAKDCYTSLDGEIVELGLINTCFAQAQQTLGRTDCFGSLDRYR